MKQNMRTWETVYFFAGQALIAAGVVLGQTNVSLTGRLQPCLLYLFFHIPCPGCGGTRAVEYLLRGSMWQSFLAHPLVLYVFFFYLYFMAAYGVKTFCKRQRFYFETMPFRKTILAGAGVVLVVQWVLKLLFW